MKYNKQYNYKIIFIIALIPLSISTYFIFKSPIKRNEIFEINSSITKDVKCHSSQRSKRLSFYLKGYENEFVINSIVVKNVNITKIENVANNFRKVKIKILNTEYRSIGDKLKFHMYDRINIVELEINNEKFLDLETYNNSNFKNNIGSSILIGFFGIILIIIAILEGNYRKKKNASH